LILAANCWTFNGERCALVWQSLVSLPQSVQQAQNGTSAAFLSALCDPCVRIFLRRAAILYGDPVLQGQYTALALLLWKNLHTIDVLCFARTATDFCLAELRSELISGRWDALRPGGVCFDAFVNPASSSCPTGACLNLVTALVTEHDCCSVIVFKVLDLASYVEGNRDRDNATAPSNIFINAINTKCPSQVAAITNYCTKAIQTVTITIHNIAYDYYAQNYAAFHQLVAADISQFLGRVEEDVQVQDTVGTPVQQGGSAWSFRTLGASQAPATAVALTVSIYPANDADGGAIYSSLTQGLQSNAVPFTNSASDFNYLADPTQAVSTNTASAVGASLVLVAVLALFNLL